MLPFVMGHQIVVKAKLWNAGSEEKSSFMPDYQEQSQLKPRAIFNTFLTLEYAQRVRAVVPEPTWQRK